MLDKDIEKRIVRYLDGELGADEELEVEREILRNPDARCLLEEYRRIDALATAVLDRVVPEQASPPAEAARPSRPAKLRRAGRAHLAWWLLPGAMAAALGVAVVSRSGLAPVHVSQAPLPQQHSIPKVGVDPVPTDGRRLPYRTVLDAPARRRVKREIHRDFFGVVGQDDNVYWIEVDRTRTIKRPHPRSTATSLAEEL